MNRLEDTHPELANFLKRLAKCYSHRRWNGIVTSEGVIRVQRGRFYNSAGTIVAMVKEPSRNAPCPCGSGLKYKKCCKGR